MNAERETANEAEFLPAVPLSSLRESPMNPRKRFDPAGLQDLETSIREKGVLTPLLVRPASQPANTFEIAAGHRRFRAARAAGLSSVPVVARPMKDAEFLEVLVIENDQREDVHPLEEAAGYQALLKLPGYDVGKIAARVGRSAKYVYDRLKLLQLTPDAQKLFLADRFAAGHAILLARLAPKDQERAIAVDDDGATWGGVFEQAGGLPFEDEAFDKEVEKDPMLALKPVSVRELESWIQREVKFDRQAIDPMLFPETAEAVAEAEKQSLKMVAITRLFHASESVRKADGERVFGEQSWKRADGLPDRGWEKGEKASKTCDRSRLGVVVSGPGQGEAFRVCIDKEKCPIHWGAWQKERAKHRADAATPGGAIRAKEQQLEAARQRKESEAKEDGRRKTWQRAVPRLREAVAEIIRKSPLSLTSQIVVDAMRPSKPTLVARGKTAEDLLRYLAFEVATDRLEESWEWNRDRSTKRLSALGVDVKKILAAAVPPPVQTSAKPGKASRGTCRKCGCTETKPCASGCGWADGTKTRCTACFPPTRKSLPKKKARA